MKNLKTICFILVASLCLQRGYSQNAQPVSISLNDLSEFRLPGRNWVLASDAVADLVKPGVMKPVNGSGVVINTQKGSNLITAGEFGDIDLDFDFMIAKGSVSGLWLQGRYKVQLSDSWGKSNPTFADMGGIGQRSNNPGSGFDIMAPLMNVARAPGLWQHMRIRFVSPKFDVNGIKISNARFEEIYLNGVLVQQQAELTSPSFSAMFSDEKASGPLVYEGNGGLIAFRNISYRMILPAVQNNSRRGGNRVVNPILIEPGSKPYLLRSYLTYGNKKRTHVISVGSPKQVNYSYDLKQGALLQVWRGRFTDVTDMWEARGEPQLAKANGSIILLTGAPALASLSEPNALWPDSIAFNDLNNKGYTLDKDRNPTFRYQFMGADVADRISIADNGDGLIREISVSNAPANFYSRLASGKVIELVSKGLYAVDGRSYYIRIDERFKPQIRKTSNGQELITAIGKNTVSVTYSMIW